MKSLWADSKIDFKGKLSLKSDTKINPLDVINLLKWCTANPIFQQPSLREIQFYNHKYYRVSVDSFHSKSKQSIVGCGRSQDQAIALSKAYAEVIERIISYDVQNEASMTTSTALAFQNGSIIASNSTEQVLMPLNSLRTTNGWAVHFNLKEAVRKASLEALERHILIYNFLKYGWSGFVKSSPMHWDNLTFHSLSAIDSFVGVKAGMVLSQLSQHGFTSGYFCDLEETFNQSPLWLHAMMEAFEPAKFYNSMQRSEIESIQANTNDLIEKVQLHYILQDTKWDVEPSICFKENINSQLYSNLITFDIGKHWGLEFNLYAAFVFGGDLIPLFFKEMLDNFSKEQLLNLFIKHSLPGKIPDVHPIL